MEAKVLSAKTKKLMANRPNRHSDETKYKTVALYCQVGSLKAVGITLGIPYQTLKDWHATDWWKSIEDDIASQKKTKLSGQIEKVRDKAVNVVEDRLDNGDFFYDQKNGELIRRPVNADTAARILNSTLTTSVRLEELKQNERRIETQEKTQDRLEKLKNEFMRFAKATQIEGKAQYAIHEGSSEPSRSDSLLEVEQGGEASIQEGSESEILSKEGG